MATLDCAIKIRQYVAEIQGLIRVSVGLRVHWHCARLNSKQQCFFRNSPKIQEYSKTLIITINSIWKKNNKLRLKIKIRQNWDTCFCCSCRKTKRDESRRKKVDKHVRTEARSHSFKAALRFGSNFWMTPAWTRHPTSRYGNCHATVTVIFVLLAATLDTGRSNVKLKIVKQELIGQELHIEFFQLDFDLLERNS